LNSRFYEPDPCPARSQGPPVTSALNHRSGGFTLLEVMVATAILAVALTAVLGSQSQSVSLATEARFYTTAPLLAQRKMAELTTRPETLMSDSGDFGEHFPGFHWESRMQRAGYGGSELISDLQRIDLTVSWGEGQRYRYHLRTYRLPRDLRS